MAVRITSTPAPRGFVLKITLLGALAFAGLVTVGMQSFDMETPPGSPPQPVFVSSAAPTARETQRVLARIGVTPRALAAAGVSVSQAQVVYGQAEAFMQSQGMALRLAESRYAEASEGFTNLRRRVGQGVGTAEDVGGFAAAKAQMESAKQLLDAKTEALRVAALSGLDPVAVATIQRIRAQEALELPEEFLAADWSPAQAVTLRGALAAQRHATATGEVLDPTAASVIAAANALPQVAQATQTVSTADAIAAGWTQPAPAPNPQ